MTKLKYLAMALLIGMASCKDKDEDPMTPVNNNVGFHSKLSGKYEVPANNSTASGTLTATFNKETKILTLTTTYTGITVTDAHIHKGAPGFSGGVEFPLTVSGSPITFTSSPLTAGQESDLMAGLYYVNLHTTNYPNGEIRGQMFRDNVVSFTAELKGSNESTPNNSTATGISVATFNKDTKIFTITTSYSGMIANGGHVHKGEPGVAGPVVFPFSDLTSPIVYTSSALDASQEADLLAHKWYVNLHSILYPDGEIRGQILKD